MPVLCRAMNRRATAITGTALRRAREEVGLSRIGLAYLAGVNLRTIERIEAGEVKARHATIVCLQQAIADHDPEDVVA